MERNSGQADTVTAPDLLRPAYWLVFGTEWHGDGIVSEAAAAVAPGVIPRDAITGDVDQVLGCADLFARKHGRRVIFFSELTRMFAVAGRSWADLGVDWQSALRELAEGRFPAIYLTVSRRGYDLICDPSLGSDAAGPSTELEQLRQMATDDIADRWSAYAKGLVAADTAGPAV